MAHEPVPLWLWRAALGGFALLVSALVLGAVALWLGAADAPVAGPLAFDRALDDARGVVGLPAGERYFGPALAERALPALTFEVTATLDGPTDAAYGLWLQPCEGPERVVVAVDGEGYVAAFAPPVDEPWRWFLHALRAPDFNRLRVDVRAGALSVRVNDELALGSERVEPALPVGPVCALGLYAASGADVGATFRFARVRLWHGARTE